MLLTDEPRPRQTVHKRTPLRARELRLRFLDPGRSGPVVRIAARRCTLGGAPSCTVRLRAFGIRPVHCVIVQSGGGWVVRNLSSGNRLNGNEFRTSTLRPGDTLALGPLAFQVLEDTEFAPPLRPESERKRRLPRGSRPRETRVPTSPSTTEFTTRIEQIERQLAQIENRAHTVPDESPQAVAFQASAATLERLTAELDEQRESSGRERELWSSDRQSLLDDLNQRMNQLAQLEAQLAEQQQCRRELESEFQRERCRLAELQTAAEQSQRTLSDQQCEFQQQQDVWDTLRAQLEGELADSRRQWSELLQQVEVFQQESAQDRARWEESESNLAEVRFALRERMTQLDAEQALYQENQRNWTLERNALESQLADARQQVELRQVEQSRVTAQWQEQCRNLEVQLESQQTMLAQQQDQLRELQDLREQIARRCETQQLTISQLQQRCAELETDFAQTPARDAERREWEEQIADFRSRQAHWESERAQLSTDLAAREAQIAEQRGELGRVESVSGQQHEAWEEERRQFMAQLAELRAAQHESTGAVSPGSWAEEPSQPLASSDDDDWPVVGIPATNDEDSFAAEPSPETDRERIPAGSAESALAMARDGGFIAPDPPVEPSAAGENDADSDVLTHLHDLGIWRVEVDDKLLESASSVSADAASADFDIDAQDRQLESDPVPLVPSPGCLAGNGGPGEDDESIENYMNRLMQRLRGPDTAPQVAWGNSVSFAADERREPTVERVWQETIAPPIAPPIAPQPPLEPDTADFRPRSLAPEATANLAAMRALANDSTRDAIATHKEKSQYYQVLLHMLGSLVTFVVAVCVWLEFQTDLILANSSLISGLAAAGYGLFRYWSYRRGTRRTKYRAKSHKPTRDCAEKALPAGTAPTRTAAEA